MSEIITNPLNAMRDSIDLAIKFNGTIGNSRYSGLAGVELERANNWLTQLYHLKNIDMYTSHEQLLETPEGWGNYEIIEDNRRRIQDAINQAGKMMNVEGNISEQRFSIKIIDSLMEAKMWLGNQLDLETKVQAVQM